MPGTIDQMKLMKVFDCQDMPEAIKRAFFALSEHGNDVYVDWYVGDADDGVDDQSGLSEKVLTAIEQSRLIDTWLRSNGSGEEHVLIKHWW